MPTARRRDSRGRYVRTYTLRYTHCTQAGAERIYTRTGRTAAEIERLGALLLRIPEERLYNIAVLNGQEDVTFDFRRFQD